MKYDSINCGVLWEDDVLKLDIIQGNASTFTEHGEVVFKPSKPIGTKTATSFGIYYGEGKGLDAYNIFAKVIASDKQKLNELENNICKNGSKQLTIAPINNSQQQKYSKTKKNLVYKITNHIKKIYDTIRRCYYE